MDRRWIRIDRAHRTFDCSTREFEAMLSQARLESESLSTRDETCPTPIDSDEIPIDCAFQLLEAINAELAQLATLRRRERYMKWERERSDEEIERAAHGLLLAELHAAWLRSYPSILPNSHRIG